MPEIKKLRVSFDLDASTLMRVLAENNVGFSIEAYQPASKPTFLEAMVANKPEAFEPLQIEDQSQISLRELVIARLRHTGRNINLDDLNEIASNNGYSKKQLTNVLYVLCVQKVILHAGHKLYRISKRHAV